MAEQRFSRRSSWETSETEWARLLRELRASGLSGGDSIYDLTVSNPTRCGFEYDSEAILSALQAPASLDYDPDPKGLLRAREAVARYYADHGAPVEAESLFLATSTSEAYSFLFRLLCDPGDEVLIARPSYPLFDFLADLDDVRLVSYPLFYDYGWHLDPAALRERITPRTRAISLVHPNNPTGHYTKAAERKVIEEICAEFDLALIVDEVFLDYPLTSPAAPSFASGDHPVLTFVLSGLSKIAALPQMKTAWIACFGPEPRLTGALQRLEVIADTFLSMSAPVQWALPVWLAGRAKMQEQIRSRTARNLGAIHQVFPPGSPVTCLEVEAGWSAVLRIPAKVPDNATVFQLLKERGVAVHSGDLFGFRNLGWLVLSLLTPEQTFLFGLNQIIDYVQALN